MKKITKSLMTLALLVLGITSASAAEESIYTKDYSKDGATIGWNQHPDDCSIAITNGCLVINNESSEGDNWAAQFHIADGIHVKNTCSYKVKITYKTTVAGEVTVALGDWGSQEAKYNTPITVSEDFQTLELSFATRNADENVFVMWQCRAVVGVISIQKVEVIEVLPTTPLESVSYDYSTAKELVKNGDMEGTDVSCFVSKNQGEAIVNSTITDCGKDNTKGIVVNSLGTGDDWSAQFWIGFTEGLAKDARFCVEFDYKSDVEGRVHSQSHGAPDGDNYISETAVGDLTFKPEWQHFKFEGVVTENMLKKWDGTVFETMNSIAFNLTCLKQANNYYFDNITVKTNPQVNDGRRFAVGSAGFSTYSFDKPVQLTDVKGWAVKYVDDALTLIPVTNVPANEGILIEALSGSYVVPVISSADEIDNDLLVSDGTITGSTGDIYVLADGTHGVGFYLLDASVTIPAGKAYLQVSAAVVTETAREFIAIGSDATAIKTIENLKKSGLIYNLSGQQVKNAKKGLYIIDGKKVMVK